MAVRSGKARWPTAAAAACAVLCLALPSAFAEAHATESISALKQSGPLADQAVLPGLTAFPGFAGLHRMHAHGYLAGFYSSADSGITDLAAAGLPHRLLPDALWIVRWDSKPTVQDPAVPDEAWMPHQRIKQFADTRKESHEGVVLSVDADYVDGSVARTG